MDFVTTLAVTKSTILNTIPAESLGAVIADMAKKAAKALDDLVIDLPADTRAKGEKFSARDYKLAETPALALIRNSDGTVNETVALAMHIAVNSVMSNDLTTLLGNADRDTVKRIHNLDETVLLTHREAKQLAQLGVLQVTIAEKVGTEVMKLLGISNSNQGQAEMFEAIRADLGNYAIFSSVVKGDLEVTSMSLSEYGKATHRVDDNAKDIHNAYVSFIKVADKKKEAIRDSLKEEAEKIDPTIIEQANYERDVSLIEPTEKQLDNKMGKG